ncbi:MAG: hypothetical protein JW715_17015, partial [Sedimentisphaerales bacterium]|nr:hypothetical protein [Sedimentisphaerales bacterium]
TNNNINETRSWQIGTNGSGSYDWHGDVDEFRICSETLSADWVKFEYYNIAEADNELTFSSEEEAPEVIEPSIGNPYMFTGRRYDLETGLYYYRARYYNPNTGRFLQTDPVGYSDGINWYNYCGSNPLNFVDPSGMYLDSFDWTGLESAMSEYRKDYYPGEKLKFTFSIPLNYVWNYEECEDDFFTSVKCKAEVYTFLEETGFYKLEPFKDMILDSAERVGNNYKVVIADGCDVSPEPNINLGTLGKNGQIIDNGPSITDCKILKIAYNAATGVVPYIGPMIQSSEVSVGGTQLAVGIHNMKKDQRLIFHDWPEYRDKDIYPNTFSTSERFWILIGRGLECRPIKRSLDWHERQ